MARLPRLDFANLPQHKKIGVRTCFLLRQKARPDTVRVPDSELKSKAESATQWCDNNFPPGGGTPVPSTDLASDQESNNSQAPIPSNNNSTYSLWLLLIAPLAR